jgi:hypothetical protein
MNAEGPLQMPHTGLDFVSILSNKEQFSDALFQSYIYILFTFASKRWNLIIIVFPFHKVLFVYPKKL